MSAASGTGSALLRLLAVQGAWTYERMLGIGMAWAALPLLAPLASRDAARQREALGRQTEFFNANPNLAPVALGALVRAEQDGVPGPQIQRLRAALCGPLGALGDQLFWAGLVPALVGLALVAAVRLGPWWGLAALLLPYNAARLGTARWGLALGLASGTRVAAALNGSWLPRAAGAVGPYAGFLVGLAVPVVTMWLVGGVSRGAVLATLAVAVAGGILGTVRVGAVTATRVALAALPLALALRWVFA